MAAVSLPTLSTPDVEYHLNVTTSVDEYHGYNNTTDFWKAPRVAPENVNQTTGTEFTSSATSSPLLKAAPNQKSLARRIFYFSEEGISDGTQEVSGIVDVWKQTRRNAIRLSRFSASRELWQRSWTIWNVKRGLYYA